MECVVDHYRNYLNYVRKTVQNRKQQFGRGSQLFGVTENVVLGEKLPCYVKFPQLTKELDKLHRDHPWAKHRGGKHNGLYFVPTEENLTNDKVIPHTKYGDVDITQNFFDHDLFKVLDLGFESMCYKMDLARRRGKVTLSNPDYNISTPHGVEIEQRRKYFISSQL